MWMDCFFQWEDNTLADSFNLVSFIPPTPFYLKTLEKVRDWRLAAERETSGSEE